MISLKKSTYMVVVLLVLLGCLDTASAQTGQLVTSPAQVVFNVQPGDTAPPQIVQLSTSNSQSVQFSIQAATQSGGPWLVFSPGSGNTPASVFVSASSSGLNPGTYQGVLNITSAGVTNSPLALPVTLNVGSQIATTPSSLAFTYQTNSPTLPASQTIAVNSTGQSAVQYNVSVQTTSGNNWLLAAPVSGTTPGNVTVTVNPAGLAPATYTGSVRITPITSGASAFDVPVTLTITGNPVLSVSPASLNFAYQTGTAVPAAQTLTFSTTGGSIPFSLTPLVNQGSNWLVLSSFSGQAAQNAPQQISVTANVTGLLPGSYSGRIVVSAPGAATTTFEIPVNLLVSANPLLLVGSPPQPFNYQLGGSTPAAQTVQVNSSSTPINFTASATTTGGGAWLTVSPVFANTPQALTLTVNPSGLAAGEYQGTVTITAPGAGNSPQSFPVTLKVSATTLLNASTSGLTFNYQTTSLQPPPVQIFRVTSTGAALTFTAAASSTMCGNNWLTVVPTTATTPADLAVSVTPTGISPPQSCSGTISLSAPGASNTTSVPVTLNVSANPLLNISPNLLEFSAPAGTNAPLQPKVISLTSTDQSTPIPFSFTVNTTSGGPWLFVAASGGNNAPSNLSITVNPSGLAIGTYNGTVTITSPNLPAAQNIPVILTVVSNVNAIATPATVALSVPSNATVPVTQQVQITSSGTSALGFTVSAVTLQGGNWLTVSPTAGSTPGTVTISASAAGLSQGTYSGQVTVVIPGAANSPVNIPVTLTVGPPQTLGVNTNALNFAYVIGAAPPANQTINVTSTGTPVNFSVSVATTSCGNFLAATPATGITPAPVTVVVNTAAITQAATCNGTVTIAAPGLQSQVINVTLTATAPPPPSITAVVNAASFAPGSVAPGEIVTLFGTNIGPTTLANYILNPNNTFATTVADTTVLFDNIPAPIIYVRNDQLSVVVPFEIAGRPTVNIQVRHSGVTSLSLQQRVVDFAPGIFTINTQGFGQGAIVNQNGVVNGPQTPAPKGSVVAIYLTGAGLMSTNPATGSVLGVNPLPSLTGGLNSVSVQIGGVPARVEYAGGAPLAIAGLYQLNVTVPQNAASGTQTVSVSVGNVPAQSNITVTVQ